MSNSTNKQSRNRLADTGHRLTAVRGKGGEGSVRKVKGLRQKTTPQTAPRRRRHGGGCQRDGRWGAVEQGGGACGGGRRPDQGQRTWSATLRHVPELTPET